MSKKIELTKGQFAIVDDEDFERINQYNWYASENNKKFRAERRITKISVNKLKNIKGKYVIIKMHRVIMNAPVGLEVDHINHNTLDNRKENLRICTHHNNALNSSKMSTNTTGFKGVTYIKKINKYRSYIIFNDKFIHIGRFNTVEDAARAYDKKAELLFGEYANLNFKSN